MDFGIKIAEIAIVVATAFILYHAAVGIYNAFFHPLASVPGPKLYATSDIPFIINLVSGKWPFTLKQLHDTYGSAVRFAPNDVSFTTASAWKEIYGHKKAGQSAFAKDKRLYRGSLTNTDNILVADDASHSRMRRLLAHAFSEKALRGQEDIMRHYVDLLISRLKAECASGRPVNIVNWYNFTTFDLIGDLAFGEPFGCLESGGYHPWVAMIFDGFTMSAYSQALKRLPHAAPFLRWMLPKKLLKSQREHFMLSFEKARKRAETGGANSEDFVSYILRHNDEKGMSADEIGENANVLIVAGSETTATLLSGTTYALLKNPSVYRKLVDELRSSFEKEEDIHMASVANMKYLLAVLNEGLRIYPPVPSGLGRRTPSGGEFIDGYWVPEDTVVSVPHWSAYHSGRNFSDPEEFVPERWLDDSRFSHDVKEVFQPFSFGPRNCLGKNLAYAEMRVILARLLWNFDLELMADSQHWYNQQIFTFWKKGPLHVKLTPVLRD